MESKRNIVAYIWIVSAPHKLHWNIPASFRDRRNKKILKHQSWGKRNKVSIMIDFERITRNKQAVWHFKISHNVWYYTLKSITRFSCIENWKTNEKEQKHKQTSTFE